MVEAGGDGNRSECLVGLRDESAREVARVNGGLKRLEYARLFAHSPEPLAWLAECRRPGLGKSTRPLRGPGGLVSGDLRWLNIGGPLTGRVNEGVWPAPVHPDWRLLRICACQVPRSNPRLASVGYPPT